MGNDSAQKRLKQTSNHICGKPTKPEPPPTPVAKHINNLLAEARFQQAGDYALDTFLRFPRHKPNKLQKTIIDQAKIEYVPVGDDNVTFYEWNEEAKKTVALLHGFGTSAAALAKFVKPLRNAGWRVIAFDFPGHGSSTGARIELGDMARTVAAIAEREGPLDAIVAHSVGGMMMIFAMVEYKAQLLSSQATFVHISPVLQAETLFQQFCRMYRCPEEIKSLMLEAVHQWGIVDPSSMMERGMPQQIQVGNVLVIHDKSDVVSPMADALRYVDAITQGSKTVFHQTERLGHFGGLEDDKCIELTVQALERTFL